MGSISNFESKKRVAFWDFLETKDFGRQESYYESTITIEM